MTTKETYTSKYYIDIDICIYFVHLNIKKFINTFEKKVKWLEKDVIRLKVTGDLGQVLFHFYNLEDPASIRDAVKHSNVVINLVGRDFETKNFKFKDVHVNGAERIAR